MREPGTVSRPIDTIEDCLKQVFRCQPEEVAVAIADSALNQRRITMEALREMAVGVRARRILRNLDPRAESGIESIARVRLRAAGIPTEVQVGVAPGVRVDLVVDERVAVELDGAAYHSGALEFENDRARDAVLNAWGLRALHFSYRQVMDDWPTVLSTIQMVRRQVSQGRGIHGARRRSRIRGSD